MESRDLVGMFTCLLWFALQLSEESTEAPFVLSMCSSSPHQFRQGLPFPSIAPASVAVGLLLPSVNQRLGRTATHLPPPPPPVQLHLEAYSVGIPAPR